MSAPNKIPNWEPPFSFTPENLAKAHKIIANYPVMRRASALMPLLDLAQRQNDNWLPRSAMDFVADMIGVPRIQAYEVATFYTMYNKAPVGKNMVRVCTTTPCWLRGSDDIVSTCKKKLGVDMGEITADGQFSLHEVECSGACVNAPVVEINDDYYEDVSPESMERIIDALKRGEKPKAGSQTGRQGSCPEGGPTTLTAFTTPDQGAE